MSKSMSIYHKVGRSITGKSTYIESDDSDYEPPEKFTAKSKKRRHRLPRKSNAASRTAKKRASKQTSLIGKRKTTGMASSSGVCNAEESTLWGLLPAEILSKIFEYVIAMEGSALPCLWDLGRVCAHWSSVAKISYIWTHMSFNPKLIPDERKFKATYKDSDLSLSHKFQYTHTYRFARLKLVGSVIMNVITSVSRQIRTLLIEQCVVRDALGLLLERHGGTLQAISIQHCDFLQVGWKKWLKELGENLRSLEIIGLDQFGRQGKGIYGTSLNHLKNLTELKLQHVRNFNTDHIKDLTEIKVLHLKDTGIHENSRHEFNHPKLEDVDMSFEATSQTVSWGNRALVEMLSGCHDLKKLCLRGRYVYLDALCSSLQFCKSLIHLDISAEDLDDSTQSIGSLLHSIGPSLRELYIDKYINLEQSLKKGNQYRSAWKMLRIISMQATNIQGPTLLSYLNDCFLEVEMLNVETCRDLPRGCKRNWSDSEIKSLEVILKKSLAKA